MNRVERGADLLYEPRVARRRERSLRAHQQRLRVARRVLELGAAAAAVVAVRGLPAVHVGDRELEVERKALAVVRALDLVEPVAQRAERVERDGDRDDRSDDRQHDRGEQPCANCHARTIPASSRRGMVRSTVLLFVILGHTPLILLVCLIALLYLTWVDLRRERLEPIVQLWWYLLVFLFNVAGYAALRIWLVFRRRRDGARRPA